jgi:Glycine-zipper domain
MKSTLIFSRLVLVAVSATAQNPSAGVSAPSPAKNIDLFAYPKNQQNRDQQLKDENDCYGSVRQQTGIDPQATAPAQPSAQEQKAAQQQAAQQAGKEAPKGGAVKGSAKGAAGGAAIGAIAGDAGTGAAIGATAGAVRGRRQQKKSTRRQPSNKRPRRPPRQNSRLRPRHKLSSRGPWIHSGELFRHVWMPVDVPSNNARKTQ